MLNKSSEKTAGSRFFVIAIFDMRKQEYFCDGRILKCSDRKVMTLTEKRITRR